MSTFTIISLVLEIVGFSLALVETVWPDKADDIEKRIDANLSGVSSVSGLALLITFALGVFEGTWARIVYFGLAFLILYYLITSGLLERMGSIPSIVTMLLSGFWLIILMILLGLIISAFWFAVAKATAMLDKIAHGRALGAFGLILAFLGVIFQIIDSFS